MFELTFKVSIMIRVRLHIKKAERLWRGSEGTGASVGINQRVKIPADSTTHVR